MILRRGSEYGVLKWEVRPPHGILVIGLLLGVGLGGEITFFNRLTTKRPTPTANLTRSTNRISFVWKVGSHTVLPFWLGPGTFWRRRYYILWVSSIKWPRAPDLFSLERNLCLSWRVWMNTQGPQCWSLRHRSRLRPSLLLSTLRFLKSSAGGPTVSWKRKKRQERILGEQAVQHCRSLLIE